MLEGEKLWGPVVIGGPLAPPGSGITEVICTFFKAFLIFFFWQIHEVNFAYSDHSLLLLQIIQVWIICTFFKSFENFQFYEEGLEILAIRRTIILSFQFCTF